jgi:hypothetical protein
VGSVSKRRRRNPVPTWVVPAVAVGTATVVGVGIWIWSSRKKRTYVGSGWGWPERNLFPTEISFGEAFAKLGYGAAYGLPGWEILSAETMNTVRAFQRDFNEVRIAFGIRPLIDELKVDGLIGTNTIRAIKFALERTAVEDDSWIGLVADARLRNAGAI